jgi:hypothetical protein
MKHVMTIMTLGALLALSACGKGGDSSSSTSTTYEVNGKQPADYFRQFLYRETGECGTIHEYHHYPKSEAEKIGVNRNGKDVLASLSLLMQDDGTFSAFYQEITVRSYFDSGYYWESHQERVVSGRWSIDGVNLVLSSLGVASALDYNGHAAMQLRVDADLLSPGLKGQMLTLRMGAASYNPIPALDPCAGK